MRCVVLQEKSNLEQMNVETSRKSCELERLRQSLERDRQEVAHLTSEKQTLEERIAVLAREKDMLNENCKNLDDKLNHMKRYVCVCVCPLRVVRSKVTIV